jgi:phosphoribosyl-ATP pyrophosphohydrolase / phosphoribosyl-AMP cyclohydrolase / histidinol dehydrogenase
MAPSFLATVGLNDYDHPLKQLSYLGHVFAIVSDLPTALKFIQANFAKSSIYLDVTSVESLVDIETLLDAGATKVFVSLGQFKVLSSTISSDRLVVSVDANALPHVEEFLKQNTNIARPGLHFHTTFPGVSISGFDDVYATTEDGSVLPAAGTESIPIVPASKLTTDPSKHPDLISVADLLLRNSVPDQSTGLIATTVCDQQGMALGLVWSSKESVSEALRTGTGVYQSRKRGLWNKGQSSGDTQKLIRVGFDCDRDCLQFVVKQSGRGES